METSGPQSIAPASTPAWGVKMPAFRVDADRGGRESEPAMVRRRSVRHFLDRPVADVDIAHVVEDAAWAPSGGNAQLWNVSALAPDVTEQFLARYEQRAWTGLAPQLAEVARQRLGLNAPSEVAQAVRQLVDRDGSTRGRPWMLVVHYPKKRRGLSLVLDVLRAAVRPIFPVSRWRAFLDGLRVNFRLDPIVDEHSIAMYLYGLTLAATERGFGSCIQYSPRAFPRALRRLAGVPRRHSVVGCVLVGYADDSSPAVQHAQTRARRNPVPFDIVRHAP